jgi:hypothetical protein
LPLLKAYFITENPMSFRGSRIEREFVEILHEQILKKIASGTIQLLASILVMKLNLKNIIYLFF